MARYDEITRRMITLAQDDIKKLESGMEIPIEIPAGNISKYYYIRFG